MADDYHTSQSNLNGPPSGMDQQQQHQQHHQQRQSQTNRSGSGRHVLDEMTQDLTYLSRDAPLDGGESTFGAATSYSQLAGSQREGDQDESFAHMGSDLHNGSNDQDDFEALRRRQQLVESPLPGSTNNELLLDQLSPDNVDIRKPMQQAG